MTRKRIISVTLALAAIAVVAGSFLPLSTKDAIGTSREAYPLEVFNHIVLINPHRLVHLSAFGVLAVLSLLLMDSVRLRAMAGALLALLAAFLEIGEFVLFHNHSFEWVDVRDDLAGIASAALLVFAAERIRQRLARGSETANPAASER